MVLNLPARLSRTCALRQRSLGVGDVDIGNGLVRWCTDRWQIKSTFGQVISASVHREERPRESHLKPPYIERYIGGGSEGVFERHYGSLTL